MLMPLAFLTICCICLITFSNPCTRSLQSLCTHSSAVLFLLQTVVRFLSPKCMTSQIGMSNFICQVSSNSLTLTFTSYCGAHTPSCPLPPIPCHQHIVFFVSCQANGNNVIVSQGQQTQFNQGSSAKRFLPVGSIKKNNISASHTESKYFSTKIKCIRIKRTKAGSINVSLLALLHLYRVYVRPHLYSFDFLTERKICIFWRWHK